MHIRGQEVGSDARDILSIHARLEYLYSGWCCIEIQGNNVESPFILAPFLYTMYSHDCVLMRIQYRRGRVWPGVKQRTGRAARTCRLHDPSRVIAHRHPRSSFSRPRIQASHSSCSGGVRVRVQPSAMDYG